MKKSEIWNRLIESPEWTSVCSRGAKSLIAITPVLPTRKAFNDVVRGLGETVVGQALPETRDLESLERYVTGTKRRRDDVLILREALQNCRKVSRTSKRASTSSKSLRSGRNL
jgi:hypothetical protein